MQVELKRPDLERFIDDQVRAGSFASPSEAIEAAVIRMMEEATIELDAETVSAIKRGIEQLDRGDSVSFDQVAERIRAKYRRG